MLYDCRNFNSSITILSNATNNIYLQMMGTFQNCFNFNQPLNLPHNVTNMVNCFREAYNFNQPIDIIIDDINLNSSIVNCFYNCFNFNSPVNIKNVT